MGYLLVDAQIDVENRFSKRNIKQQIRETIEASPDLMGVLGSGVALLREWLEQDYYESKAARLNDLKRLDLDLLVMNIAVVVMPMDIPMLFTSVVGQVANHLNFSDKVAAIKTVSEVLTVLAHADMLDIMKPPGSQSLHIQSAYDIPEELREFIHETKYLPPMICEPGIVTNNNDCAYLTYRDQVILGSHNHHGKKIRLDAINRFNKVPLKLDTELLLTYDEMPKEAFKDSYSKEGKLITATEKEKDFEYMRKDSMRVYYDLIKAGNRFYLTHKPDKRGRMYAQGYHCNTQGASFKKAIIEFAEEEITDGVPTN